MEFINARNRMIEILPLSELPLGRTKRVVVEGKTICLSHLTDGVFATDDTCSHERASLSMGWIVNDCQIECPRHGARFDIKSGDVRSLPAVQRISTYPVKVENGIIYVDPTPNN